MGLLFLCIILCIISLSNSDLISSSQVQNCVLDGASEDTILNCEKKFVVSLSVDNAQNQTESVQFTVSSATEGGNELQFVDPWTITISKSRIAIYYPISYIQTVNADPYEDVIYTRDYLIVSSCKSGAYSDNPTCGWYVVDGKNVPDSQGYCCACNLAEYFGISDDATRADLTCSFFSGASSSAHCLRFSKDAWYDVFEIGNAQNMYTIDIGISKGGKENANVTLSPSSTIAASPNVIARLLGDFSPFQQVPVYSSKYLVVPSSGNPRESHGMKEWMLINNNLFDFSGRRCGTIGVSFAGFNSEASHCKLRVNSCLSDQIEDYYQSDLQMRNSNRVGNYFLPFFGDLYYAEAYFSSLTSHFLAFDMKGLQASVITLTFSADDIRFVTNRSPGQIIKAYVEEFEALSKDGKMHVVVVNNGTINAQFEITVTQCSTGIAAVLAQQPTLVPRRETELVFDIRSENALEKTYQCRVALLDSQAQLLDVMIVFFNTTATDFQTTAQGGDAPSESGDDLRNGGRSSCSSCNAFYDIICFLTRGCWKQVFTFVGTLVGILGGVFLLYKIKQHFGMCGLCSKVCCCCGGDSDDSSDDERERKRKKKAKARKARRAKERKEDEREKKERKKEKARDKKELEMEEKRKEKEKQPPEESYRKTRGNLAEYSYDSYDSYSGSESSYSYSSDYDYNDLEEGRNGHLGMSPSDIRLAAHDHTPVYLCFSNVNNLPLYKCGPQFCLRGEIKGPKNDYEFSLEAYSIQTKYFSEGARRYISLNTPRRINVELFRLPLNEVEVCKSLTIRPPPNYQCINNPQTSE